MSTTSLDKQSIKVREEEISLSKAIEALSKSSVAYNLALRELGKRLLYEKAFDEYTIEVNEEKSKTIFEQFCKDNKLDSEEKTQEFLTKINISKEELVLRLGYQVKIEMLKSSIATPEAVKQGFLEKRDNFDRVVFRMIRVKEQEQSQNIYKMITQDFRDFSEMARAYSMGDIAQNGGLVGPVNLSNVSPDVKNVLLNLKQSEVSDPFSLDNGETYIIVQFINVERSALTRQIEIQLRNELFEQWTERNIRDIKMPA